MTRSLHSLAWSLYDEHLYVYPHLLVYDRVSLVLLPPVGEPGVVFGRHHGLTHLVDPVVGLDPVRFGRLRHKIALWEDVQVSDWHQIGCADGETELMAIKSIINRMNPPLVWNMAALFK